VATTTEDAPADVAFSAWLPSPSADRAAPHEPQPELFAPQPVAPQPVVFSAAPLPAPSDATARIPVNAPANVLVASRQGPQAEPEQISDLPPVPQFVATAAQTTKAPDVVTPAEETRREIARAHRTRKIGKAGGVSILVGALVAAGVVGLLGYRERPVTHHAALIVKPVRTQRTLLFALADPAGDEAALLADDPRAGTSSVTLLPSRVVTTVVGQGQVPLGRAVALADPGVASGSISDLLGVDVDASWRVTPQALATLVDSLGGITVDVDTQVISSGTVIVQPGVAQHLGGGNAVAYAQYLAPGEDETARLARLQKVLTGILAVLPAQAGRLPAGLGALGAPSESSLTPSQLASQLLNVAAGNRSAAVPGPMFSILPVTTLDSGGSVTAYRVDPVAMASYVSQNLAASVPPGAKAGGVRVYVYSGTLQYGLGTAARSKLVDAGLSFVGSANEAAPSTSLSVVLVPDGTDASRAVGQRVAKALGLPTSSIEVSNVPQDVADVIVIAGSDFRF